MDILREWHLFLALLFCHQCRLEMTTGYKYLGCFRNHSTFKMLSERAYLDPLLTPHRCSTRCDRQPYSYFMLKSGKICVCFEDDLDVKNYETSEECHLLCKGDTAKTCGGKHAVEIYKVYHCPRLQRPANGHMKQNHTTAWFWCSEGYQLEGASFIHCSTSSHIWNGPTNPLCIDSQSTQAFFFSTQSGKEDEAESLTDLGRQRTRRWLISFFLVSGFTVLIVIFIVFTRKHFPLMRFKIHSSQNNRGQNIKRNQEESNSCEQTVNPVDFQKPLDNDGEDIDRSYDNTIYALVKIN